MNRQITRAATLAALLVALACRKGGTSDQSVKTGAGEDVDRAVAVVLGIRANRSAAESVLSAHQLTAEQFDSLMYEIASDSAKAAAYAKAIQ
jgi:hypothetical protein